MSFVRIQGVSKSYNHTRVLNNVSLSIEEGEFITLLGPSGCGKSTLLRAIAGLNPIDEGKIEVGGKDITHMPPKKRNVGMVFQSYALFPNMTVFDNIAFGLKMEGLRKDGIRPLVEEMLNLIDLKGKEDRYPSQLSGGQQQRVALARSLVKKPTVLLLDEPLSALDAKIRRTLRGEIRHIQRRLGMTTIFVTHDQEEALTVSDRIFVMKQGEIEQAGTPNEIYTSPASEYVARFIGNYNVWSRSQLQGRPIRGIPDQGNMFAVRPEAIRMAVSGAEDEANEITAEGTVSIVSVLGNVLRFEVDVTGLPVTVDMLSGQSIDHLRAGTAVRLSIPRGEWKSIQPSS
ncbi:ATP-binding cassette domain-containing protein [Cohnella sp. CFH 77786]|uniref:ABC transporter ATP-binding protein n=1 Tax=Cohnella sp. CFH 77786 TaxID=2662265 RepID=UPI001C609DAF|nr:ABC transporter ATP-binding protein [Cohnella sp. CFH 77786]MBW5448674.1 ATP-binding cassette domain-containing protein [Cohnella sp. CFH 77786]